MRSAALVIAFLLATTTLAAPRVLSVVEPEAAIGKTLTLRVDGNIGDCKSLILFIQRSPIHGLAARCSSGTVAFDLAVNEKNADKWHGILGGRVFTRTVTVGLGSNDKFPFDSLVTDQPFRLMSAWRFALIVFIAAVLAAAIVIVRRRTTALDSLARSQIAIWIVVVVLSYIWLWSLTGETDTMNGTVLALLAIGGGTAIGDAILKGSKRIDAKTVVQTIANAPADDFTPSEIKGPSGLQALIVATWTAILAVVFVSTVFSRLEMPEFSAQVLMLLGISGGTYLAFSMTQRH